LLFDLIWLFTLLVVTLVGCLIYVAVTFTLICVCCLFYSIYVYVVVTFDLLRLLYVCTFVCLRLVAFTFVGYGLVGCYVCLHVWLAFTFVAPVGWLRLVVGCWLVGWFTVYGCVWLRWLRCGWFTFGCFAVGWLPVGWLRLRCGCLLLRLPLRCVVVCFTLVVVVGCWFTLRLLFDLRLVVTLRLLLTFTLIYVDLIALLFALLLLLYVCFVTFGLFCFGCLLRLLRLLFRLR